MMNQKFLKRIQNLASHIWKKLKQVNATQRKNNAGQPHGKGLMFYKEYYSYFDLRGKENAQLIKCCSL